MSPYARAQPSQIIARFGCHLVRNPHPEADPSTRQLLGVDSALAAICHWLVRNTNPSFGGLDLELAGWLFGSVVL